MKVELSRDVIEMVNKLKEVFNTENVIDVIKKCVEIVFKISQYSQGGRGLVAVCPCCLTVVPLKNAYYYDRDKDYDGAELHYIAFKCPSCGRWDDIDTIRCEKG